MNEQNLNEWTVERATQFGATCTAANAVAISGALIENNQPFAAVALLSAYAHRAEAHSAELLERIRALFLRTDQDADGDLSGADFLQEVGEVLGGESVGVRIVREEREELLAAGLEALPFVKRYHAKGGPVKRLDALHRLMEAIDKAEKFNGGRS